MLCGSKSQIVILPYSSVSTVELEKLKRDSGPNLQWFELLRSFLCVGSENMSLQHTRRTVSQRLKRFRLGVRTEQ